MGLSITKTDVPRSPALTLQLQGELDTHTSTQLDQELQQITTASIKALVLDMQKLNFISSAGVGVILKAQDTLKKKNITLTLAHLQPQIKRVFEIMQLTPILNVCASQEELDEYLAKIQKRILEEGTSLSIEN